jgi:hypothetical protein
VTHEPPEAAAGALFRRSLPSDRTTESIQAPEVERRVIGAIDVLSDRCDDGTLGGVDRRAKLVESLGDCRFQVGLQPHAGAVGGFCS